MPEQQPSDTTEVPPKTARKPRSRFSLQRIFTRLFEGLQWITEHTTNLLRMLVTLAMFSVVAFIIYNAYATRNTVAVKPFQVPVSVGRDNHEHAGRIIANQLNRHLLETQNTLREQLQIDIDQPVPTEESVLIEGESIKLPETGITIDNVIEFISGIFGRKNLSGSVYFEPDKNNEDTLHLQLSLRGRIISLSENDLSQDEREKLPPTHRYRLNIKLISALLKNRSKEILSIASEDHNLYYYCTRDVAAIEHKREQHDDFFGYCNQLRDGNATPDKLEKLKGKLVENGHIPDNKTIVGSVIQYINNEINRKQLTLCQSGKTLEDKVCKKINLAKKASAPPVATTSAVIVDNQAQSNSLRYYSYAPAPVMEPIQALVAESTVEITPTKLSTLEEKCNQAQSDYPDRGAKIASSLEDHCFASQKQNSFAASSEAILQANKLHEDALQQYNNGAYQLSAQNYQQAITQNCHHDVAWGNLGILLSKATDPKVRDIKQGQCALLRATKLNSDKFWLWHSLCVAQAFQAEDDLEQFLSYESCQTASTITPTAKIVNERLFNIEIGSRYVELGKLEQAAIAYVRSMKLEKTRGKSMAKAVAALVELEEKGVEAAKGQACRIYKASIATEDQEQRGEYEKELDKIALRQGCSIIAE